MAPGKVDELVHVLEVAREEAKEMAATHTEIPPRPRAIVRTITDATHTANRASDRFNRAPLDR